MAAAEMAFAGGIGAALELAELATDCHELDDAVLLFSESNTRFLVEVTDDCEDEFRDALDGQPVVLVGHTQNNQRLEIRGAQDNLLVDSSLAELKHAWQSPLDWD